MPKFIITTTDRSINNPDPEARIQTSMRRSRAVRHARKLRAAGNRAIMLFEVRPNRTGEDNYRPVSLKPAERPSFSSANGCNSWHIGAEKGSAEAHNVLKFTKVRTAGRKVKAA